MFYFLCKSILHGRNLVTATQSHKLLGLSPSLIILRCFSSSSNQHSFTVSYLKNNCGLPSESAFRASKYVNFETPENPDSVIAVLKNHGFSETQIIRLIKRRPRLLISDAKRTILPKIEFFASKGVSVPDIAHILSSNPALFALSLEKKIIPCYDFLSTVLKSDERIFRAVKRYPRLIGYNPYDILSSNIDTLLDNGVAECNIASALFSLPSTFVSSPDKFKFMVEEAKELGLNPSKPVFMVALFAISSMSKETWKRKIEVFKKLGWSEEEIFEAFQRYPSFIRLSEDKFMVTMDFLVNKMGFPSNLIAKRPRILLMSIEKKIVPRGLFALDLLSKGVIKRINLHALFETSDHAFIEKFINRHKEEASQLLKLFHEKLDLSKNWRVDGCKLQHL
ncbi:hypothetical protein like AT5G07900 [Hibiscus trionum]|uniref:Uncharacterized protein n=1 Tax=Hibiscus trionum TaxID=183268 RepID=A0A9W7JL86_HIBTR|nr:hypothetical protein like AT5G07900 [Hibiscus trionum]